MAVFNVTIKAESPLHLGSGQADVIVDAEVIHDRYGMPVFPAKRLKGLLYESGLEVAEMSALCGRDFLRLATLQELFQHGVENGVQLILHDFQLAQYEVLEQDWEYLQAAYPELITPLDVLEEYTSVRYQTAIDPASGVARDTSLHNMRVVDAGVRFQGQIALLGGSEEHAAALALALRNLKKAGLKRNRGFGQISCTMDGMDELITKALSRGEH